MAERGITDEKLADEIGVERPTVTRWRSQQHRLNPDKIGAIAKALDVEPAELWRPPSKERPSLDALLKRAPDEIVRRAAEMTGILMKDLK